jgi:hypothetical protein
MTMNSKKRDTSARLLAAHPKQTLQHLKPCNCLPLSSLHKDVQEQADWAEGEQIVPAQQELAARLRTMLNTLLPRLAPMSVFLLHISQWERTAIVPQSPLSSQRRRYHAPPGLLEQVMANVNRVMRIDDRVLTQENVGVAIILPDVDQQGAQGILERVYRSISLLQAETVIPPLTLDTTILLGMGTYPVAGPSVEDLLYATGLTARRFTLRPALTSHLWDTQSLLNREDESTQDKKGLPGIPFMSLPQTVPQRLKHFIPYPLALEMRCVPVGRDAHCLTVAMVDPTNVENIVRLQNATGMTIFPVSCDLEELYTLLAKKW